jgi:hypothetical protein
VQSIEGDLVTSASRCRALFAALAVVLTVGVADVALGGAWRMFGGGIGRTSFAFGETGGPPLALAWKATAPADQGVWTSPIVTQGARPLLAYGTQKPSWISGPTSKGNVHIRDLATGAAIGPEAGVNVDDGSADSDTFGDGHKASVAFADSSAPGGAPGQLFVVHNDDSDGGRTDSEVAIAQVDEATGTVVQDVHVPATPKLAPGGAASSGQNGSDVSGSPALLLDANGDGALVFRVGLPVYDRTGVIVRKVENVHVVPLRNARSTRAVIDTDHQLVTPDFQPTSRTSPTLVTLADPSTGDPTTYIAMGTSEPGSTHYVKTFRLSDLKPGPVSEPLSGWGQTVAVPLAADGLAPGAPGSGMTTAAYVLVATGDASDGWVYKLEQQGSRLAVVRSIKLRGYPSPALATNALVGPGAPSDGKIVLTTHRNLYVLRVGDLGIAARFSPTDDLDKGCAPCDNGKQAPPRARTGFYVTTAVIAGKGIFVARDDGSQLVLDLDTAQPVPPDQFTQDPANASSTFTRGEPAVANGMAVFASVNGVFAYRLNAGGGGGGAPPPEGTRTFTPVADAHVRSTADTKNYGSAKSLKVEGSRKRRETYRSYLKFEVSGLSGPAKTARLRLYVNDAGPDGGDVFPVANEWGESSIKWSNAPAPAGGGPIAAVQAPKKRRWTEIDVSRSITADGTYSFALVATSKDSTAYDSREGSHPPELVVAGG